MSDEGLDFDEVRQAINRALSEDVGSGDVTSISVIPADRRFKGAMRARHPMVIAGLPVASGVFAVAEPASRFRALAKDGDQIAANTILAEIEGPARGLLTAERTALNFLQLLSGIATTTRAYADRIEGTGCVLLDTRKTVPGLRRLSKYATRCGGAQNHRMGLFDGILIKDNHIAVCGGVKTAVQQAKASSLLPVEVECDTLEQVTDAIAAGADCILLDNMSLATIGKAVAIVAGRAKIEVSGGVNLETIRAIAETGVNYISVGRITQSAPAADIGLDWL